MKSADILCLSPGVTYPRISTSANNKTLLISFGNRTPWQSKTSAQAIVKGLDIKGNNWTVEGLTFQGNFKEADLVEVHGDHVTFRHNFFKEEQDLIVFFGKGGLVERNVFIQREDISGLSAGADGVCIRAKPGGDNLVIQDNEFVNCGDAFQNNPPERSPAPHNLMIQRNIMYITPQIYGHCKGFKPKCQNGTCSSAKESSYCSGAENAIDIKLSSGEYTIRDNIMYGFRETNPELGQTGSRGEAITYHMRPHGSKTTIERNIFFDGAAGFFIGSGSSKNFTIRNNLVAECCTYSGLAHPTEKGTDYRVIHLHQINDAEVIGNMFIDPLHSPSKGVGQWIRLLATGNVSVRDNTISGSGWESKISKVKSSTEICENNFTADTPEGARERANCNRTNRIVKTSALGKPECVDITPLTNPGTMKCFNAGLPKGFQPLQHDGSRAPAHTEIPPVPPSPPPATETEANVPESMETIAPTTVGFETGSAEDWQLYHEAPAGSEPPAFLTVTDTEHVLTVILNGTDIPVMVGQEGIPLEAEEKYRLTLSIKGINVPSVALHLHESSPAGAAIGLHNHRLPVNKNSTWQPHEIVFTATKTTENGWLGMRMENTGTGQFYVNNLKLEKVREEPTPPVPEISEPESETPAEAVHEETSLPAPPDEGHVSAAGTTTTNHDETEHSAPEVHNIPTSGTSADSTESAGHERLELLHNRRQRWQTCKSGCLLHSGMEKIRCIRSCLNTRKNP